jgi:nucleoside-diphosphate-sugar epimerase
MRVVITGGAGFVGLKLAAKLLHAGVPMDAGREPLPVTELVLFDTVAAKLPGDADARVQTVAGDITDKASVSELLRTPTDSVFHLAAVVSAAAEADLDLGLAVNLDGTRHVLDACRQQPAPPRLVFASSAAVYGGDPPFHVTDATQPAPRTSYGAQKVCGEYLVSDYSRRGIVDGRSVRLPTIVVRPGKPNKAASTFASSILREPLAGQTAICPVKPESRMAILSPRRLIDCLLAIHAMGASTLDGQRTVLLPSLSVSIEEMIEGLRSAAGEEAVSRVKFGADPLIQRIVDTWPERMTSDRAARLGLKADESIGDIIQAFIEDDLPAQTAMTAEMRP